MKIEKILKIDTTVEDKISMILSNNIDIIYCNKPALSTDKFKQAGIEILAWHKSEVEKLHLPVACGNLPIYGVTSRALANAVNEEAKYDYTQHGESWQWAINEMSDEVNEAWRQKMKKIYDLACQLDEQLKLHGL